MVINGTQPTRIRRSFVFACVRTPTGAFSKDEAEYIVVHQTSQLVWQASDERIHRRETRNRPIAFRCKKCMKCAITIFLKKTRMAFDYCSFLPFSGQVMVDFTEYIESNHKEV